MLVLERKLREVITIGPDITIEVLEIRHGRKPKVYLGISAPRSLAIDRPDARVRVPRREPARAEREQPTIQARLDPSGLG